VTKYFNEWPLPKKSSKQFASVSRESSKMTNAHLKTSVKFSTLTDSGNICARHLPKSGQPVNMRLETELVQTVFKSFACSEAFHRLALCRAGSTREVGK
jgi:hypothetical protein